MKKALRILQDIKRDKEGLGLELDLRCLMEDIQEAIEDMNCFLERNCENCKSFYKGFIYTECKKGISSNIVRYEGDIEFRIDGDFCCNKWEQK